MRRLLYQFPAIAWRNSFDMGKWQAACVFAMTEDDMAWDCTAAVPIVAIDSLEMPVLYLLGNELQRRRIREQTAPYSEYPHRGGLG